MTANVFIGVLDRWVRARWNIRFAFRTAILRNYGIDGFNSHLVVTNAGEADF